MAEWLRSRLRPDVPSPEEGLASLMPLEFEDYLRVPHPDVGGRPADGWIPPPIRNGIFTALDEAEPCLAAVWEGFGGLPTPLREAAAIQLCGRWFYLARGTTSALAAAPMLTGVCRLGAGPNYVWPASRHWLVACDIDGLATYVAGPRGRLNAIRTRSGLDCEPVDFADPPL